MRPDEIGRMTLMIDERERGVRTPYSYCVGVFNNTCILELANKHIVLIICICIQRIKRLNYLSYDPKYQIVCLRLSIPNIKLIKYFYNCTLSASRLRLPSTLMHVITCLFCSACLLSSSYYKGKVHVHLLLLPRPLLLDKSQQLG